MKIDNIFSSFQALLSGVYLRARYRGKYFLIYFSMIYSQY